MSRTAPDRRNSADGPPLRVPGLRCVSDAHPGIRRVRRGRGFSYVDPEGRPIRDRAELDRIAKVAVPPAWTDVWICPDPNGHILAIGRDAKGRKQYRYHPRWRSVRDEAKYEKTFDFGTKLPALRTRVRRHLREAGLPKEKVVATVVRLLDTTLMRVGNEEYARDNGSFGLTTLRDRHVKRNGSGLTLRFRGKGGKEHTLAVEDPRIARVVWRCRELSGQDLFQYVGDDGEPVPLGSSDVNDFLRDAMGEEFTAKDFRTWAASVLTARELAQLATPTTAKEGQRALNLTVDHVAEQLGNTRAVCRNCYIHPDVIEGYLDGSLRSAYERHARAATATRGGLRADERFLLSFLRSRRPRTRRTPVRRAA
jgi:DNA topoisomerase I